MTDDVKALIAEARKEDPQMTIIEEHTYRSATLLQAPARATRVEAEADEARGVEVEAFLRLLPELTLERWQSAVAAWDAAREAAWNAAREAAWDAAWDAARGAARDAARVAARVAARDTAWDAARVAVWDAVWDAALGATRGAARGAALDAVWAIVVRDLITLQQFDILTAPMRAAGIDFDNLGGPQ